jgi:MFS family permease
VRWFTDAGRPVVAVVVLIMCAPGEHHLAVLAGWDGRLAWGMAAVLAAYAGIAASVASNRPKGSPGKVSAVVGACVSLGAAMAAQPVSHAFVTGHLSSSPRTPLWLVIVVSCVPPLVFGHLLHLAATPVARATETPSEVPVSQPDTRTLLPVSAAPPWRGSAPAGTRLLPIAPSDAETDRSTPETHRFLTTREVAIRYGKTVSTVRTWKDRGKIVPAFTDPQRGAMYDPETLPNAAAVG